MRAGLAQQAAETPTGAATPKLPGSLAVDPYLDSWIRLERNEAVTVFTGKAELGQGIKTALLQVAAEELGLPIERLTRPSRWLLLQERAIYLLPRRLCVEGTVNSAGQIVGMRSRR